METLASQELASPETEPELQLLLERDRRDDWRRWRSAAVVSVAVHIILLVVLLLTPESETRVYKEEPPAFHVTPLYIPTDLTQKAPNKGKLSKELTLEAIAPRPIVVKAPSPTRPVKQAPLPLPQTARVEPKQVVIEPPKIEPPKIDVPTPQTEQLGRLTTPLPPPAQPPKLVLENVGSPPPPPSGANAGRRPGLVALPNTSVQAAIHDLTTPGNSLSGRQSVADGGNDLGNPGLNLPPSAGRPHSNLELRSDPMGVDFRPYMMQVLAAVRRNWFAVYPEAARLGQRGQVVLEFAIAKQGLVTKVIFSSESGAKALDQSAVAAISASNPLPPLPTDFKGDRIVLRMTFLYNMPR
ncbi:MAG TPA: energy transducer TonB [Bryobacteraceae bacterium]|jgi:TonB family protein|nr:energy transducer TonB [Bryobacteraceae bacterium]